MIATIILLLLAPISTSASSPAGSPGRDVPQPIAALHPRSNPMHPPFAVLDEAGVPIGASGRTAAVDITCGACHDATYIHEHSDHWTDKVKATCVQCHFESGRLPADPAAYDESGTLRRDAIRISPPRDENCALCHGIVHEGLEPLGIPADFGPRAAPNASERTYKLTLNTGEVFSSQDISASYLNIQDKTLRTYPWDVHARRLVSCVDCHFAANNPIKADVKHAPLGFVVEDPRRIAISTFLQRPDHRMAAATCRSCHDPMTIHDFLPYKKRHFDALECQACHVPHLMGPAAQTVDATVTTPDGRPLVQYRGLDMREGESLNAAYARGYSPILLSHRDADGETRLAPFNVVDRWFWAPGSDGAPLSPDMIASAYLQDGSYAPEILAAFDSDQDGRIGPTELRLDTAAKTELIRSRLRELGVVDPVIRQEVSFHPIEHGVQAGEQVQRDCAGCHQRRSRLTASLALASYAPVGADPSAQDPPLGPGVPARIEVGSDGTSVVPMPPAGVYVLGHSRRGWADRLGFTIFVATLLGVGAHAFFRFVSRRARDGGARPTAQRIYLYTAYERLWHWLMGLSILALMVTGLQIHFLGTWKLIALPKAVAIHNFFAVVLTVNAFLSLFYHLATSAIRQFLPPGRDLIDKVAVQARYYTQGIFLGQPHPSPKTPERKLNPLQQITYLVLLNALFPIQVVTGVLIWGASRWPHLAKATGGLTLVAPMHSLCAWFFLAFVLLHVYLTTTGHTVFSSISAMIDGYEEIDLKGHTATGGSNA